MIIRPVGAELLHADRRTDIMKLIVAFRNFANAPKKKERGKIYGLKIHEELLKK